MGISANQARKLLQNAGLLNKINFKKLSDKAYSTAQQLENASKDYEAKLTPDSGDSATQTEYDKITKDLQKKAEIEKNKTGAEILGEQNKLNIKYDKKV